MKIIASSIPLLKERLKQQLYPHNEDKKIERKRSTKYLNNKKIQKNFNELDTSPNFSGMRSKANKIDNIVNSKGLITSSKKTLFTEKKSNGDSQQYKYV